MSTSIPVLDPVTDILDTDKVMVTNAQGLSYTISGAELNKRNKVIIASNTTVTGAPLKTGSNVRIYFSADITGPDGNTVLQINYNTVNYYVKAPKDGALTNFVAHAVGNTYKYVQAYTTLEMIFDGTQFVIIGNPVVISNSDYSIQADGLKTYSNKIKQLAISDITYNSDNFYIDSDYTRLYYNDYQFWGVLWFRTLQPIGAWGTQMSFPALSSKYKMKEQFIRSMLEDRTMIGMNDFSTTSNSINANVTVGLFFSIGIEPK